MSKQLSEEQLTELRTMAKHYELKGHHFHKDSRGFIIITRAGVEQIAAKLGARVEFEPVHEWSDAGEGRYVIKAQAWYEKTVATSYGEVSSKNNRNAYPVAMAEKRAMSRAVLKLAGLYKFNVYGEDEVDAKDAAQ